MQWQTSLNYFSSQTPLTHKVSHAEAIVPFVKACFLRKHCSIQKEALGYGDSRSCFPVIPDWFTITLALSCFEADFTLHYGSTAFLVTAAIFFTWRCLNLGFHVKGAACTGQGKNLTMSGRSCTRGGGYPLMSRWAGRGEMCLCIFYRKRTSSPSLFLNDFVQSAWLIASEWNSLSTKLMKHEFSAV